MKRLSLLVLIAAVAGLACGPSEQSVGNGADMGDSRVKNAAQATTLFRSNGDGSASACVASQGFGSETCNSIALRRASEYATRARMAHLVLGPEQTLPSKELMSKIAQISVLVGAAPVIARLPVSFSPAEVGIGQRNKIQLSASVWNGAALRHQSNDPQIARTTIALAARLRKFPGYSSRTVDSGMMLSAMGGDGIYTKSGRRIAAVDAFAQLGAVPFVRMYVTSIEVETLLQEKFIAGVELDVATTVSDDASLSTIGVKGWTVRDEVNGWWEPALVNPPVGRGAIIAISDTGVESAHPAFGGRVIRGACFEPTDPLCDLSSNVSIASGAPCQTMNSCFHGTSVAGVAAGADVALAGGGRSPRGVAPEARIVSYRTCTGQRRGGSCSMSALISAMGDVGNFIATGNNVVSFNMSHTLGLNPFTVVSMVLGIVTLAAADVMVIHANGNDGLTNHCDVRVPGLVVVANMLFRREAESTTNFSPTCTTMWAPGSSVNTASFTAGSSPREMTAEFASGTSIAAPQVSGAAALIDEGLRRLLMNSDEGSLVENFSRFAGFGDPSNALADNRTECVVEAGVRPCVGSRVPKPMLSLRSLAVALQPNSRFRTLEGEHSRYAADLAAGAPVDWRVEGGVDQVLEPGRSLPNFSYNWGTKVDVRSFALEAGVNRRVVRTSELRRMYAVVENGTLAKYRVNGVEDRATLVSRGPRACSRTGWYEVWRLAVPVVDGSVEIEIAGPKSPITGPRGDLIFIESLGQATVDEIPVAISAPNDWVDLPQRSLALELPDATFSQFHADLLVAGRDGDFGGQSTITEPLREDPSGVGGGSVTSHLRTGSWGGLRSYGELSLPSIDFPRGAAGRFDCVDVLLTISHWW